MHIVPANINREGLEAVYSLGENPTKLDSHIGSLTMGFAGADQYYIPGISIPGEKHLDKPFYVPIIGDDEPVSLITDVAHMDAPYFKRVTFIGKLVAESISLSPPMPDREPFLDDEDTVANEADEAFEDLGEDGGFLRVTASSAFTTKPLIDGRPPLHGVQNYQVPPIELSGDAEFYLFDDYEEFEMIDELLFTGKITAMDILSHMRAAKLNKLLRK